MTRRAISGSVIAVMALVVLGMAPAGADIVDQHVILSHEYPAGQAAYDYSPTMVQSGDIQEYYWCGYGPAHAKATDDPRIVSASDVIYHATYNVKTHVKTAPIPVLTETPDTWDERWVCNLSVVMGFAPFGDGQTYAAALYYVGSSTKLGTHNSIGVAFTNDWTHFRKWSAPVLSPPAQPQSACQHEDGTTGQWVWNYGFGQPSAHNDNGHAGLSVFYTDACAHPAPEFRATTTDGVRFTNAGQLNSNGLDGNQPPANPALAFNPAENAWYMASETASALRAATINGTLTHERARWSFTLYRIPANGLLSGNATAWQPLVTVDTNLTGYETNGTPHSPETCTATCSTSTATCRWTFK